MDMDDPQIFVEETEILMSGSIDHLQKELGKVRAGKANPAMVADLFVSYYGNPTPVNQVANVSTSDARTIVIQPWEKSMLSAIERSIFEANLGVTPQNDGEVIRISIPPLTEERRKDLVKAAKSLGEEAKVSIRNNRRDAMDQIKKSVKDGFPEDMGKRIETNIQELTDNFTEKIDKLVSAKEKEIMTI
jgi:ribosome recycling factor